jgi:CheY-like chemotaxis protein
MYRILSVGLDPSLSGKRNLLLQSAGYSVTTSSSLKEAANRIRGTDLDLILLCHSIPATDRERMTCLIRASGSFFPVISVAVTSGQRDLFPDATLDEHDQATFLWSIHEILVNSAKKRSMRPVREGRRIASRRMRVAEAK